VRIIIVTHKMIRDT